MELSARQIRAHRLRAHHLDQKYPFGELLTVAGTCGLQNSPPGAWETAAFCRLSGCTLPLLQQALYQEKELLQAWSIRGVPLIFPTADSDVFLSPLAAQEGRNRGFIPRELALRSIIWGCLSPNCFHWWRALRPIWSITPSKQGKAGPGIGPAGRRTAPCSKTASLELPLDVRRARPADGWRRCRLLSAAALLL